MTYNYSSTAGAYSLTGGISSSATSIVLDSVTGLPSPPFKVVLNPGEMNEEIVKVTGVAGTTLTVTRGWDSSAAVAHDALSTVRHMMTGEDLRLSRQHEAATSAHGVSGAVVGTTDAQALTNKNLTSGTNSFPTSLATVTGAQALTNKDMTSGTNSFPDTLATVAALDAHRFNVTAAHGVTGAVVGTTNTQTLTNKTLSAPVVTGGVDITGTATLNGVTVPKIKVVEYAGTTDANGYIVTTHGLGFTPTAVLCYNTSPGTSFATFWGAQTLTSTQFTTRWAEARGTPYPFAGAPVSFVAVCFG